MSDSNEQKKVAFDKVFDLVEKGLDTLHEVLQDSTDDLMVKVDKFVGEVKAESAKRLGLDVETEKSEKANATDNSEGSDINTDTKREDLAKHSESSGHAGHYWRHVSTTDAMVEEYWPLLPPTSRSKTNRPQV